LQIFQCCCSLNSEQKIYIDSYKYKGKRRNHFVKVWDEQFFGIVKMIVIYDREIHIGVQILDPEFFIGEEYPIFKKSNQTNLSFYYPFELETIGYMEDDVEGVDCIIPLYSE